jgi:hypothetical protein
VIGEKFPNSPNVIVNITCIRRENLGIFNQSQLRTYSVKSQYNTFRGVNGKILRLGKILLQFTEKEGDDCFDDSCHIIMVLQIYYHRRER